MSHLSLDQLAKLRQGSLSGTELLAADDHLAVCPECRAQLTAGPSAFWVNLARELPESAIAATHVPYDALQAYADEAVSQADRMRLETHLAACPMCREEVEDLKQFANQFRERNSGLKRYSRYLILGPIAAVLLVGMLLVPRGARPPELAIAVHDRGKLIGVDRLGRLAGADSVSPEVRDQLIAVLHEGRLVVNVPEGLRAKPSVLLGSETPKPAFQVVSPVGEPVLDTAVTFHWNPVPGASGYEVQVFDADYQPVISSPKVTETAWTTPQALARGRVYVWQVTAFHGGATVKAPQPPDPEARFLVLDNQQASTIEEARLAQSGHLVMAQLYAHAGLCREASGEVDALEGENAGSPVVSRIRSALASQCGTAQH